MTDYSKTTNFTAKDALSTGDPLKLIKGSLFDTEYDAIVTAIATKFDSADVASQAQAEALSSNLVLITPARLADVLADNAGILTDLQALADPGADVLLGWDESANDTIGFTLGNGLEFSTTSLIVTQSDIAIANLSDAATRGVDHSGVTMTAGTGITGGGTISATRTFNLDISGLTALTMDNLSQSADGFLVDNAGVMNRMAYDATGIKVAVVTGTADLLAAGDMNTFIEYTNSSAVTVTLNNSVGARGNVLIIKQTGAGTVTIDGTADVQAAIGQSTRAADSVITLVCLVEGASAEWALYGDASA